MCIQYSSLASSCHSQQIVTCLLEEGYLKVSDLLHVTEGICLHSHQKIVSTLGTFIIPSLNASQASDEELGFSSGYLARLWPAIVLKHHETLRKMLTSPSAYFPLTEQHEKMPLKEPAAINHFRRKVQRPMLQDQCNV